MPAKQWLQKSTIEMSDTDAWRKEITHFKGKLIAIAPGSVWGTKRWTREGYLEVAKSLTQLAGVGLILLGGKGETVDTAAIAAGLSNNKDVWDLAGKTTLDDLRGIYPNLSLLVANDSSAVHYASSFNVPTVAIFGATIPEMGFGPKAEKSETLELDLECRPCSDHGPKVCPLKHFKCMRGLKAADIVDACARILS